MCQPKHPHGFTYLWVLISVALLGLGLTIGTQIYQTQKIRSKEQQLLFIGHQYRNAIQSYYQATPGPQKQYPSSIEDLLRDPRFTGMRRHLRQPYIDPITNEAQWGLIRVGDRIVGIHSLSNRMPIKIGRFEPQDAHFEGAQHYSDWKFTFPYDLLVRDNRTSTQNTTHTQKQ